MSFLLTLHTPWSVNVLLEVLYVVLVFYLYSLYSFKIILVPLVAEQHWCKYYTRL